MNKWVRVATACEDTFILFSDSEWRNWMRLNGVNFNKPIKYIGTSVYNFVGNLEEYEKEKLENHFI